VARLGEKIMDLFFAVPLPAAKSKLDFLPF
jgi:hypothetical protein